MAELPVVQILNKNDWFKQALVPIPGTLPPLKESSLRVRTRALGLTSNNFTYCKFADLANWWDVHPIPPSTPAPYNDGSIYGRTSAWGYAEVIESTFAAVPKGSFLYGYLPIGTLPLDFEVMEGNAPGQVFVTEPYRKHLLPVYNRYFVFPASIGKDIEAKADSIAYDSLFRGMHLTAYLLSKYMFAEDPKQSVNLTPEQADLSGATVLSFAPGSKVGLAFARTLRSGRGASKPARVVGAASESSLPFVKSTGLYDAVEPTTADPLEALARLGAPKDGRIVVFDFGGRAFVAWKWAAALLAAYPRIMFVIVGSEISGPSDPAAPSGPPPPGLDIVQVMADTLQNLAMHRVGEKEYFDDLGKAWEEFKAEGIPGIKFNWGDGVEGFKEGWDRFAKNEVKAEEGLMFKL